MELVVVLDSIGAVELVVLLSLIDDVVLDDSGNEMEMEVTAPRPALEAVEAAENTLSALYRFLGGNGS